MLTSYYAFFDVDGTLLKENSMLSFLKFFYQEIYRNRVGIPQFFYRSYMVRAKFLKLLFCPRALLNRHYYYSYKNQHIDFLKELGKKWHEKMSKKNDDIYNQSVLSELNQHQKQGAEIVFISGAFSVCLEPLAKTLNVKYILSTPVLHLKGKCTGRIAYPMIGGRKGMAVQTFLEEARFPHFDKCYAYGDHWSDVFMLKKVGHPYVVRGDAKLESWAKLKNIPII